ncbi:MAG TPA: 3'(2'),5'-bisphosphate nucleotidase [Chromatiales bacterium]|nr:3'(2'),5'-bisphosphate nucleotidase [Chromatiales bacterium]
MDNPTINLNEIVALARAAGDAIMEIYDTDFEVEEKSDKSPLTAADMASHNTIVAGLERLTPEIPILSEESAKIPYETRRQWRRYWLIDPLDGTKEFIKRNGEFTVNIALIEDGRPVLGVVYVPVKRIAYYAAQGEGAWRSEEGAKPTPIRVRDKAGRPVRVAGSRSHAGDSLKKYLENLGDHEIVSMGSSLKLCLVAEGDADLYPRLGPTSEWDTAAAQAVVEAAGGMVTDTKMQPLRYNTKESLLNPYFLVFGDKSVDWSRYMAE